MLWFKKKINEKDIEEKIKSFIGNFESIKNKFDNPHNRSYRDKLNELLQNQWNARDNFINWITGLAIGTIIFIFNRVFESQANDLLIWSGLALFSSVILSVAFKICLEVRYSALQHEVALLRLFWEGHNIKSEIQRLIAEGKEVDKGTKDKFLDNYNDIIEYSDDEFREKLRKPIKIKSWLLIIFYWIAISMFIIGIILAMIAIMIEYKTKIPICQFS